MDGHGATARESVTRDFKTILRECTVQGACGREFILVTKLKDWMKETHPGCKITRTSCLLQAAYHERNQPSLPIEPDHITYGEQSALLIFCILLELDLGKLIDRFHSHELLDRKLPIALLTLREKLDGMNDLPRPVEGRKSLADQFDEKQWRYCAAHFDLHMGICYTQQRILPICLKQQINKKGGTATLWYIEVDEEFVGKKLRDTVPSSRFLYEGPEGRLGHRYAFALKSFREGYKDVYENEKIALKALRRNEWMVKYLSNYDHQELRQTSGSIDLMGKKEVVATHNILLEYADLDLTEYFAERLPPVFPTEIEAFWNALFEVANALEGIHNLDCQDSIGKGFDGWHADIKPDNILSVQGKFKLADPGFAVFVAKSQAEPKIGLNGGTQTYGAPECLVEQRETWMPVTQTVDVWSLGCVFSVAATWVILGYQGLRQFEKLRQKATKETPQRSQPSEKSETDYFHNGRTVLPEVTNWHQVLRNASRKTDTITIQVLDLVDECMLLGDVGRRIKAKELCEELKKVSSASGKRPRNELPESIRTVLLEVDDTAPSKSDKSSSEIITGLGQGLLGGQDRQTRKSVRRELPLMKTAHRSEYRKSALDTHHGKEHDASLTHGNIVMLPQHAKPPGLGTLPTQSYMPSIQESQIKPRTSTPEGDQAGSHQRKSSKTHMRQTIAQAREEMKLQKTSIWTWRRRDARLTEHFDNRDIRFLIDNAHSMVPYWNKVTETLDVLVRKVAGQDKDGVDLSFTCGRNKLEKQKGSFKIRSTMLQAGPHEAAATDMGEALGDILSAYLNEFEGTKPKKRKGMTLIVLTDGVWAGMTNKTDAEDKVVHFLEQLRKMTGLLKNRLVSIEFVQFGHDVDATHRLRHLDGGLKWRGVPDIIDTEHESGDIYKMLLGSFVAEYDDEDEVTNSPSTPLSRSDSSVWTSQTYFPESMPHSSPSNVGAYPPPSRTSTQSMSYGSTAQDQRYPGPSGFPHY